MIVSNDTQPNYCDVYYIYLNRQQTEDSVEWTIIIELISLSLSYSGQYYQINDLFHIRNIEVITYNVKKDI